MVVGELPSNTEVLVIGGGPGGYTAAFRAGQHDLAVTLVEPATLGGVCLHSGCIPSKVLLSATELVETARDGEHRGIHADPAVDMPALQGWTQSVMEDLASGIESQCDRYGVDRIEGRAEFFDDHEARITHGETGGSETIEFEQAIIATGSSANELEALPFSEPDIVDAAGALTLDDIPPRMTIVGAGYIGLELASVFARLGSTITVLEMEDAILPGFDDRLSSALKRELEALGIEFRLEASVTSFRRRPDDALTLETSSVTDGSTGTVITDTVLVAVGRSPTVGTVNLEAVGLDPTASHIEVDDECRTAIDHIFAVGDVTGDPMLAHAAYAEGRVAGDVVAERPNALDYRAMPAVIYTDPQVATVGETVETATAAGYDPIETTVSLRSNGRAKAFDRANGRVTLVADRDSETILGGQLVAPHAGELVSPVSLAIEMGATVTDLARTIQPHPTLVESIQEAAMALDTQLE